MSIFLFTIVNCKSYEKINHLSENMHSGSDTLVSNGVEQIIYYNEGGLIERVTTRLIDYSDIKDTLGCLFSEIEFKNSGFVSGIQIKKGVKLVPKTDYVQVLERNDYIFYDSIGNLKEVLLLNSDSILLRYKR
jgi:hypothetical protein